MSGSGASLWGKDWNGSQIDHAKGGHCAKGGVAYLMVFQIKDQKIPHDFLQGNKRGQEQNCGQSCLNCRHEQHDGQKRGPPAGPVFGTTSANGRSGIECRHGQIGHCVLGQVELRAGVVEHVAQQDE